MLIKGTVRHAKTSFPFPSAETTHPDHRAGAPLRSPARRRHSARDTISGDSCADDTFPEEDLDRLYLLPAEVTPPLLFGLAPLGP